MIDIFNINLIDIMPESLKSDPDIQALCDAITPEIQAISNEIIQCILLARVDELQDDALDHLAWQLHVDFYDSGFPVETKRQLVKNSVRWHRRKGTPAAVEELITAVFGDGKVVEWFKYSGEPYKFKVITSNQSVTGEQAAEFIRALNSVKNTRSWLESIEITMTEEMPIYFAGILHFGENLTVEQVV